MNVFRAWRGYRQVGPSYGLPVFYVDFGSGVSYSVEALAEKLFKMGLQNKQWVVLREGMGQRGVGTLVYGLKQMGVRIEVEASTNDITPGWFPAVDRWLVWWMGVGRWNLGALRMNQDMVISKDGYEGFVKDTEKVQALRGVIGDGKDVWDLVKNATVRVYKAVEDEEF